MSFDKEAFEEQVINDMREHGGVISSGPMAGTRLLVLTTTGAKTGLRRRALVFFSKDGADYVIAATASGSTRDPAWLDNVEANPTPSVEVDGRQFEASATIAAEPERDRLWRQHLEVQPQLAEHAKQAGRTIPMVRLTPRPPGARRQSAGIDAAATAR
jgi:deazaflavin-dependent oxidoreductase (nitroreductase family)